MRNYPLCTQVTEYTLIVIYSLLILTGLFANIVVSFVVARRPQMHTARNLFIVNLTLSDMTLCVVCMPFTLLKILRRQWSMGEVLCKLVPVLQGKVQQLRLQVTYILFHFFLSFIRNVRCQDSFYFSLPRLHKLSFNAMN